MKTENKIALGAFAGILALVYFQKHKGTSGIGADTVISASDKESLVKIAYAMSISENGYKDKAGQDIKARYDLPNIAIINEGWKLI